MSTFVANIIELLNKKNLTISTCESVTGGMIGSHLVSISGASNVYKGGLITYSNESKIRLANVDKSTIDKYGAISEQVATEICVGCINKFKSDIAISITGNAGPNPMEQKEVGLAYVCICIIDKPYVYKVKSNETERNAIRVDLTFKALSLLLELIKQVCTK